jgi:hypothetical protein
MLKQNSTFRAKFLGQEIVHSDYSTTTCRWRAFAWCTFYHLGVVHVMQDVKCTTNKLYKTGYTLDVMQNNKVLSYLIIFESLGHFLLCILFTHTDNNKYKFYKHTVHNIHQQNKVTNRYKRKKREKHSRTIPLYFRF